MNTLPSYSTHSESASTQPTVFFEMSGIPICTNLIWTDRQAACQCVSGDVKLAFYPDSGFIENVVFDPSLLEYSEVYENALDHSPRFQEYIRSLAMNLIERYDLHNKDIIEIGCGKGDFLLLLCELGNNRGVGFDPSYIPRPIPESLEGRITFIQDYYSDRYADYQGDFIACRHTLEHIPNPEAFLKNLRRMLGDRTNTKIFFEVPNALDTFRNMAVWDIIYEHCCYFAPVALSHLFSRCGFQIHHVYEEYQGQFLCIEATPDEAVEELTKAQRDEIQQLHSDVTTFANNFNDKVKTWKNKLAQITSQGKRAVVWGAGAKGVIFLNMLKGNELEYIVDINPRKHGMHVAGTGQQIVSPEFLQSYQPDVVFVMNRVYEGEIRQMLQNFGLEAELLCV